MKIDILFAGVPISNLEAAQAWYSTVFGRPPDIIVADDEVMWRFSDSAWLYIVVDAARAGHAIATLCVADLDATLESIAGRGITGGPVAPVGDGGRKAVFKDVDGNSISFIEVKA